MSYSDNRENGTLVNSGEFQFFSTPGETTLRIGNPHESRLINYLQLWFTGSANNGSGPRVISFDLEVRKNQLMQLFSSETRKVFIGKLGGREEVCYTVSTRDKSIFVFVIQGAFEVQHRLLENRDGLALWDVGKVEIEALSNDAIILLVEL